MDDGVAVLDHKTVRYFNNDGTENTAAAKDIVFNSTQEPQQITADNEGKVYATLYPDLVSTPDPNNPSTNCVGAELVTLSETSALERFDIDDCDYIPATIAAAPNGSVVTMGGSQWNLYSSYLYDDRMIKYDADGDEE